ncbi:hypothetical protein [Latilactobacillus curvatus]
MQSTINFYEDATPTKIWIIALPKENGQRKAVKAHGCVCGSDGAPMVFTNKRTAERSALVLSKYMSDKLRVFKVSGLKLEVD